MINILNRKVLIDNEHQSLVYAIRLYTRKVLKYLNSETLSLYDIQFFREETTDM